MCGNAVCENLVGVRTVWLGGREIHYYIEFPRTTTIFVPKERAVDLEWVTA